MAVPQMCAETSCGHGHSDSYAADGKPIAKACGRCGCEKFKASKAKAKAKK